MVTPEQLEADKSLREHLQLLLENGLKTEIEPRAYTHDEIIAVIARLQSLKEDDYEKKMVITGFTLTPYMASDDDEQACETCMYYRVHQKYCELPELMLPVEAEWSCTLWRI